MYPVNFQIEPFEFESEFDETAREEFDTTWIDSGWQPEISPSFPPFALPRTIPARSPSTSAGMTACPKGLICLEHFHVPKTPNAKKPGNFVTGSTTRLEPKNMNPGVIDSADTLVVDRSSTGLQTCLVKLITTQFQNFLSRDSIKKKVASRCDRVRIGLIDLTGNKSSQPDFAGWGSTLAMEGASVPKILALYAAFQVRFDLRQVSDDTEYLERKNSGESRAQGLEQARADPKSP